MRFGFLAIPAVLAIAGGASAAEPAAIKDKKDKVSYGIGVDIANNIKRNMIDVNPEMVLVASNTGNQFGITARGARDERGPGPVSGLPGTAAPVLRAESQDAVALQLDQLPAERGDLVGSPLRVLAGAARGVGLILAGHRVVPPSSA